MASAKQCPEPAIQLDYKTWLSQVNAVLQSMSMPMGMWQANWPYDFRADFSAGLPPRQSALRAHDFWWRRLQAEAWT